MLVPAHQPPDAADADENRQRDDEQKDGDSGRRMRVAAFDAAEDVDGRDFGLERQVAGDQDDRSELADRAGVSERDAGEDGGEDVREDDPAEGLEWAGAERRGGVLDLLIELEQ